MDTQREDRESEREAAVVEVLLLGATSTSATDASAAQSD